MVNNCVVLGCGAYRTGGNIGFYSIPTVHKRTDEKTRTLMLQRRSNWLNVLLLRDPPSHVRVCGRHFVSGQPAALVDVHSKDWIPSLHLPIHRYSESVVSHRKKTRYAEPVPEGIAVSSSSSSSSATDISLRIPIDCVPQDQENFHQR